MVVYLILYFRYIGVDQYVLYNASSTVRERPIVIDRVTGVVSLSSKYFLYFIYGIKVLTYLTMKPQCQTLTKYMEFSVQFVFSLVDF